MKTAIQLDVNKYVASHINQMNHEDSILGYLDLSHQLLYDTYTNSRKNDRLMTLDIVEFLQKKTKKKDMGKDNDYFRYYLDELTYYTNKKKVNFNRDDFNQAFTKKFYQTFRIKLWEEPTIKCLSRWVEELNTWSRHENEEFKIRKRISKARKSKRVESETETETETEQEQEQEQPEEPESTQSLTRETGQNTMETSFTTPAIPRLRSKAKAPKIDLIEEEEQDVVFTASYIEFRDRLAAKIIPYMAVY